MLLKNKFTTKDNIADYQKLMSIESHDQLDQIRDLIGKLPSGNHRDQLSPPK